MTPPAAASPSRPRILFAPVTLEQARLFSGIGRLLDRRGCEVRFAAPCESIAEALSADWSGLVDMQPRLEAQRQIDAYSSRHNPLAEPIGRYDAWRAGWSEPERLASATTALAFWTSTLDEHAADAVVVWNGRDHVFVEAAVASARQRGVTPLFMELGPLRREPMTVAVARGGVNAAAEFRRPEKLAEPLTPWEAERLAAARRRFVASIRAKESLTQRRGDAEKCNGTSFPLRASAPPRELSSCNHCAFLPLQVDDDTQLFYYMPHFPNQESLVRAVVAALPADLPLLLKLHPLADERRGRRVYEPLLRPQDRIASPRTDTLSLIAAAAVVITNNSSAGIEALMLERPVAVLGEAHYRSRGFTGDFRPTEGPADRRRDTTPCATALKSKTRRGEEWSGGDHAVLDGLSTAVQAAIELAVHSDAIRARDRYLYELLFCELVHVADHPLRAMLPDEDHERLAIRLLDLLRPLDIGSDWSPAFAELSRLRESIHAALATVTATRGAAPTIVASRATLDLLHGVTPSAPLALESVLNGETDLPPHATVLLLAPDWAPGPRQTAHQQLLALGASQIIDALHTLASVPCNFHTHRFNILPRKLRDELHRRSDYWDYYLEQSGIRPEDSPAKQTQAATIAAAFAKHSAQSILEYGCGDARILNALRTDASLTGLRLTGVDASERMLMLARERLGHDTAIRLLSADARTGLPFADGEFDATITCGVLPHVHHDELPAVIAELQRVTRTALLHWEAFEAYQPTAGDHYTNPQASLTIHRAAFERYGPIQTTIRDVRPLTGQPALFCEYRVAEPLITVLTLHAIAAPAADVDAYDYRNMFLPPDRFAALLDGLFAAGYHFLTISDAAACLRGDAPTPHKAVVLTFDDGYASVFDAAFPLMQARGIRGAAFIPTDFIGAAFAGNTRAGHGPAQPTMTADQLRTLRAAGWDIGAHSCSHPVFAALDDAAARRELLDSRARLTELLGEPVRYFAFPYGEPNVAFTPSQAQLARECGFDVILSTLPGFLPPQIPKRECEAPPEPFTRAPLRPAEPLSALWPRIGIDHDATPASLLDDLANIHRETSGWPTPPATAGPSIGERVRRVVQHCIKRGVRRIALYGAGQHTARLLQSTPLWPLHVAAIVDDDERLRGAHRHGLPIHAPTEIPRLELDAILISSDRYEDAIYTRLAPLQTRGVQVLRLYAENA